MNMRRCKRIFLLIVVPLFIPFSWVSAQDRCGIVEYTQNLRNTNTLKENDQSFEDWLNKKISSRKALRTNEANKAYRVPVVVHVIHKGEAIGTGVNISDAQIISQIRVLNEDFKRANADSVNTPAEFQSLAGKFNVEFVLAKQDPNGLATTGINRVKGTKTTWASSDDTTLKALSYWAAEDYLNIWVTDLSSTLLGYAQFPISTLSGLESAVDNRLTDGVVIDYTTFGSNDDGSFSLASSFNKGRTATHEIGHFFGLRHIWGDVTNSCSGTDYVDDTPNQNNSTSGCPSSPQTVCSGHKMFQNYMDYTDDACMNIYTQGQVARMVTVIENSPRRVSLLTSHGLEEAAPLANDAALISIRSPQATHCANFIIPVVVISNKGSNAITSVSVQVKVNSVITETKQITLPSALAPGASAEITLSSSSALASGSYAYNFQIITTNGVTDAKLSDNELAVTTLIPYQVSAPFTETFSTIPSSWTITNSDQQLTWALFTAPQVTTTNTAIGISYYQNTSAVGTQDVITTPVFDLSQAVSPFFAFDVAYAVNASRFDGLKVYVITDCSGITEANKVYDKAGTALATAPAQTTAFTPSGSSQWRREIIDLHNFIGYSRVQLAFVGVNAQGNTLFVDNIAVTQQHLENVAITKIINPAPVRCGTSVAPVLSIQNKGTVAITSLKINSTLNSGTTAIKVTDASFLLPVGKTMNITLPEVTLLTGENTLAFELAEPNGWSDLDVSDNFKQTKAVVNATADRVPLREKFEGTSDWISVNPTGTATWTATATNYNQSMYYDSYTNALLGDQAWLVSPVIDFSSTPVASVFFDLSYRSKNPGSSLRGSSLDTLKVYGSLDCGNTYSQLLLAKSGAELSAIEKSNSWLPSSTADWERMYINLNSLAGQEQGRLAFVFVNGNGNNGYLDNVEFYESDNTAPPSVADPFLVYNSDSKSSNDFFITFNLEDRQDVNYELMDLTGRSMASAQLQDVLNQTFEVNAVHLLPAIYVLRLQIGGQVYARKVFVGK